jgi:Mn2+/Fe2+ NRAMP family transporter
VLTIGNIIEAGADIGGMAAALNLVIRIPIGVIVVIVGLLILALQIRVLTRLSAMYFVCCRWHFWRTSGLPCSRTARYVLCYAEH